MLKPVNLGGKHAVLATKKLTVLHLPNKSGLTAKMREDYHGLLLRSQERSKQKRAYDTANVRLGFYVLPTTFRGWVLLVLFMLLLAL